MKASQLITLLQTAIDKHGDMLIFPTDAADEFETVWVMDSGHEAIIELGLSGSHPYPGRTRI